MFTNNKKRCLCVLVFKNSHLFTKKLTDISGRVVPVPAHGRELCPHDQPRVRGVADQGVLPPSRHRVQVKSSSCGSSLLPGGILRPCGTYRPLSTRRSSVKLRLRMKNWDSFGQNTLFPHCDLARPLEMLFLKGKSCSKYVQVPKSLFPL